MKESSIYLRQLDVSDGPIIYRLLQRIPRMENGVINTAYGLGYREYKEWLRRQAEIANGIALSNGMVAQTVYWFYVEDVPVGVGKIRHELTNELREGGGNISYCIEQSHRGKGYGTQLLAKLIEEARRQGVTELLAAVYSYNKDSIQVALHNGGTIVKTTATKTYVSFE